jgi:hypothetical protein
MLLACIGKIVQWLTCFRVVIAFPYFGIVSIRAFLVFHLLRSVYPNPPVLAVSFQRTARLSYGSDIRTC